jgi:hypothetical protein
MNDNESRKHQMFVRVQQFLGNRASDFQPSSLVKELAVELTAVITQLDTHAAAEASGGSSARQGTVTRAEARAALREDLDAINRTAREMHDQPGLNEKFRLPRGNNDQQLIATARHFVTDALPLKDSFIAHELSSHFLEDIEVDIEAFLQATGDQSGGKGNRVAASAGIDEAIERGTVITRALGAIMKNKYGNNRATIAEWTSASHTERPPRRRREPDAGVPAPAPTTGGPPPPPSGGTGPTPPPAAG